MKQFIYILYYPFTVLFYLCFGLTLLVFHLIQWVCFNVFGYQAHKKSVDFLNLFILLSLRVLGTRFSLKFPKNVPKNAPIIIVSNHQSLWDIPPIIWYLRKLHVKFVSKKELARGIPSVSYNLRHGGSVLIDRKNPKQALEAMKDFARYLSKTKRTGLIFPEGTRSFSGTPKRFQRKGLGLLLQELPTAYVLPITINNSWKLQQYGMFPMPFGVHIKYTLHPFIKVSDFEIDALIDRVEKQIKDAIL